MFKWIFIVVLTCALFTFAICICRCFCLKKVKVDPRGLSVEDLKNPAGSIKLTLELQKKMKERALQRVRSKKEAANLTRSGHLYSREELDESDGGDVGQVYGDDYELQEE